MSNLPFSANTQSAFASSMMNLQFGADPIQRKESLFQHTTTRYRPFWALTRWLDGTQIRANDLAVWIFVCEVKRPDARPGPDVKTQLRIFQRHSMQLALERECEAMRHQVQPVLLLFVFRQEVSALAMGMVTAAILECPVQDG